jgi:hypothetical protein
MKDSLDCVNCIVCIVDSLFVIVNAMRKESVAVVRCKLSFIELHKQATPPTLNYPIVLTAH